MKTPHIILAFALSAAFGCRAADSALPASEKPRTYDFAYQVQSDGRPFLVQLFDDGQRTYLQFSKREPAPAIFAVTPAGQVLLTPKPEGQFYVIERVEQQLLITLGATRTTVRYTGKERREDPPAIFRGGVTPVSLTGAPPAPVPVEKIIASRQAGESAKAEETMKRAGPVSAPVAIAEAKPGAKVAPGKAPGVLPAVTKAGADPVAASGQGHPVAAMPAVASTGAVAGEQNGTPAASAVSPPPTWKVLLEDRLISTTLARWAKDAGWSFSFETPRDFETKIAATFPGTFEEAVTAVVTAYAQSDSPIKAVFSNAGANKALRILKYQGNSND